MTRINGTAVDSLSHLGNPYGTCQYVSGVFRSDQFGGMQDLRFMRQMMLMNRMNGGPTTNDSFDNPLATLMTRDWMTSLFDPRRNINDECGYPSNTNSIPPEMYRELYDREPVANRVVKLMPKESWQVTPIVYEDEDPEVVTPFEEAWDELGQMLRGETCWYQDEEGSPIWDHLKRADILSGIGHFGILLLGIDDGRNLQDPVDGVVQVTTNRGQVLKGIVDVATAGQGDCFMTPGEEKVLNDLGTVQKEPVKNKKGDIIFQPAEILKLNEGEKLVLNEWRGQRDLVLNRAKKNGGKLFGQQPKPLRQQDTDRELGTDQQYQSSGSDEVGMAESDDDAPEGSFSSKESASSDTDPAGSPTDITTGDLSGTDAQYFGVQFGPSEKPSQKPTSEKHRLLFIRPYSEDLVQIVRYEWNINNPRFGMPVMYRVTLNDPREQHSGVGLPMATVFVHWSRVIHLADNLNSSEIFGEPRMRPVLNPILDIQKVRGAAAEGYWKGSFYGLNFMTHPQLGGDVEINMPQAMSMMEQYQNGLQRYLITPGGQVNSIAPGIVDPTPFIEILTEAVCIQKECPVRVFKGSERGELASSQDDSQWNDKCRSRENDYLTPRVVVPFIDRLIQIGVLPEPGAGKGTSTVKKSTGSNDMASTDDPGTTPTTAKPVGNRLRNDYPIVINGRRYWVNGKLLMYVFRRSMVLNAQSAAPGYKIKGGYSIQWPDLEALGDSAKATILLQKTQALAAYVSGNCQSVMPPEHWFQDWVGMDDEEVQELMDSAQKAEEDQMNDAMDQGFKPTPPPGFTDPSAPPPMIAPPGGKSGQAPPGGAPGSQPKPQQPKPIKPQKLPPQAKQSTGGAQ